MKLSLLPLAGLFPVFSVLPAHGQALGVPVLNTPGTATWLNEVTATGTRTVFTIIGNTVLDWGQFNLGSGSELVFDFVGGNSVVNMLNGTGTNTIAGNVTSNGSVGFFSPNGALRVTGSVTAENVTLAAMNVEQDAFNAGETFTLTAGSGSTLTIGGSVTATHGNVVLAGKLVRVTESGQIQAADAVRMGGGTSITVEKSGFGRRLKENSGNGFVLHLGETRASRIEIAAGQEITNRGRLDTGSATKRIFLEVGKDGQILREGNAVMVGQAAIKGDYLKNGVGIDRETDSMLDAVSNSTVTLPALKRPGGKEVSKSRTVVNDVPMSASTDSGRDRKRTGQQLAKASKPLLQRASFFGMRGGSEKR